MTYSFRPRPIGGALTLTLTSHALEVSGGMKVIKLNFVDITRVQLVYRPSSLLQPRYMLYVRDRNGARLKVANATYRGLAELVMQEAEFNAFLAIFLTKIPKTALRFRGETPGRYNLARVACFGVVTFTLFALYKLLILPHMLGFFSLSLVAAYVFYCLYLWLKLNKTTRL